MELKFEFLDALLAYDSVPVNRPWLFDLAPEVAVPDGEEEREGGRAGLRACVRASVRACGQLH